MKMIKFVENIDGRRPSHARIAVGIVFMYDVPEILSNKMK